MDFRVQRYNPGQPLFSAIKDSAGLLAIFSSFTDDNGEEIHKSMERADTLIPLGTYKYSLYFSPGNGRIVLILHDVPGYNFIEHHIANWPHELKGCTAHGMAINVSIPELENSRFAFNALMKRVQDAYPNAKLSTLGPNNVIIPGDILGTITYEMAM